MYLFLSKCCITRMSSRYLDSNWFILKTCWRCLTQKKMIPRKFAVDTPLAESPMAAIQLSIIKEKLKRVFHPYIFPRKLISNEKLQCTQKTTIHATLQCIATYIFIISPSLPNLSMSFAQTNQPCLSNLPGVQSKIFRKTYSFAKYLNLIWQTFQSIHF